MMARLSFLLLAAALAVLPVGEAAAANSAEEKVEDAKQSLDEMLVHPDFKFMRELIRDARAVVIIPNLFKGGFIFGAERGKGVILARRSATSWSYPAFLTMTSGSFGLQIGGELQELVLVVRNQKGLESLLSDEVKLGADASIAVGPMGAGAKAATTTNLNADIVAFARSKGLFGGLNLEGGIIETDRDRNELYYKRPVTSRQILLGRDVFNPHAEGLRETLARASR